MIRQYRLGIALLLCTAAMLIGAVAVAQSPAKNEATSNNGALVVPVTNLQNVGKGQLLAILYKKVNRVEVNGVKYFRRLVKPVTGRQMTVTFEDVPFGDYAIAVMHDMDKNLKMATTWVGIPDEDLGVSNNVKGGPLGGPKWTAAKFAHRKAGQTVTPIKMWQCYD